MRFILTFAAILALCVSCAGAQPPLPTPNKTYSGAVTLKVDGFRRDIERTAAYLEYLEARTGLIREPEVLEQTETLLLGDRATLQGNGPGATTLKWDGTVTPLIANDDGEPASMWRHTGAHTLLAVRDVQLDGGQGVNDRPWQWNADEEYTGEGIHLYAGGQQIKNVGVYDVRGWGVFVDRRPSNPRMGEYLMHDRSECILEDVVIRKVFGGVTVKPADAILRNVNVAVCRDIGIRCGAAMQLINCHVWGCGQGLDVPYCLYAVNVQAENIRGDAIVFRKWANNSTIAGVRIFACKRGIVYGTSATVTAGWVEASEVCLDCNATGAWYEGALSPKGDAIGAKVSGDKSHLDFRSWGGGTAILIDKPVSNCRIIADVGGCDRGLVVEQLGYRNVIEVNVHADVGEPVVLPDDVHSSNRIIVNGVINGRSN